MYNGYKTKLWTVDLTFLYFFQSVSPLFPFCFSGPESVDWKNLPQKRMHPCISSQGPNPVSCSISNDFNRIANNDAIVRDKLPLWLILFWGCSESYVMRGDVWHHKPFLQITVQACRATVWSSTLPVGGGKPWCALMHQFNTDTADKNTSKK